MSGLVVNVVGIEWDTDGDYDVLIGLPTSMDISIDKDMVRLFEDEAAGDETVFNSLVDEYVSDSISDEIGYAHKGFVLPNMD